MDALQTVCFFVVIAITTSTDYHFWKLTCAKLSANPVAEYGPLKSILIKCSKYPHCVGITKESEDKYRLLMQPLTNATKAAVCSDYIFDKSNATVFKGSPTFMDNKLIFQIYFSETSATPICPYEMKEINGRCQGTNGGEARCQAYPSYMESVFEPTTGICSVLRFQDLIDLWQ